MRHVNLNLQAIEDRAAFLGIDSVSELARRAGIDRTYLSRILRGERPAHPSHATKIASALGVNLLAVLAPEDPEGLVARIEAGA